MRIRSTVVTGDIEIRGPRYLQTVSICHVAGSPAELEIPPTILVCVEYVVICIAKGEIVRNRWWTFSVNVTP